MALSMTVRGSSTLGNLNVVYGDWTGNAGDASGTFTAGGAYPLMVIFQKFDPIDSTYQIIPRVSVSVSSQTYTITIHNQDNVANGRFFIVDTTN